MLITNINQTFLRIFNDNYRKEQSEHIEERYMEDKATNIHHIFPEAQYKELSAYIENLIALTPTQHFNFAHPNGNTQDIDEQYPDLLLLSKADRIYEHLISDKIEHIYDFNNFLFVLKVGFECEEKFEIQDMNFNSVMNIINIHYTS